MYIRHIVTGNNTHGKSYFLHDNITPGRIDMGTNIDNEIWVDDPNIPNSADQDSAGRKIFNLAPSKDCSYYTDQQFKLLVILFNIL
ncbi:MAG TPA: hypothetical protein QF753_00480 [Victivallales bacterium]|nr:hypothetical protein [Victivallales bacterium]